MSKGLNAVANGMMRKIANSFSNGSTIVVEQCTHGLISESRRCLHMEKNGLERLRALSLIHGQRRTILCNLIRDKNY
jgi:hypothetical protein